MDLHHRLEHFLAEIPVNELVAQLNDVNEEDKKRVRDYIITSINEARTALDLFESYLSKQRRILEVGAGLGILGAFLKQEGYRVTLLEPGVGGFEIFELARQLVSEYFSDIKLNFINLKAHEVDAAIQGEFDFIFSVNVMEHIPELEESLCALMSVLSLNGSMVHLCPNYIVPYEPHFGCPVFKPFPGLTLKLYAARIEKLEDVWDSLNFITSFEVKKLAKKHKWNCNFKKGIMSFFFARLDKDEEFRERQGNAFIMMVFKALKFLRIINLFRHIPGSLSTPMLFELKR